MYYALYSFETRCIIATGLNSTSKEKLKQEIVSHLQETNLDKNYLQCDISTLCAIMCVEIEEQEEKFEELDWE